MSYEEAYSLLSDKKLEFGNREHIHAARVISADEALSDKELLDCSDGRILCVDHGSDRIESCVVCREIDADILLASAAHQLSIQLDRQKDAA